MLCVIEAKLDGWLGTRSREPLIAMNASAARPIEASFRAAEMLGCAWQEAWLRFSETPARFMGLPRELGVGRPANFCVLKVVGQNQLIELKVYANGETSAPD